MTPQTSLAPACPVVLESSNPPFPKSSSPSWTTRARPMILFSPLSAMTLSKILTFAILLSSANIFPRSPTCLITSLGAPWSFWKYFL